MGLPLFFPLVQMSVHGQYADRHARIVERVRDLTATRSGHEEQAALFYEAEGQVEATGHASYTDDAAAPASDEDTPMDEAVDEDGRGMSHDALTQFRQGTRLWRLSDCRTLAEEGYSFHWP
ncbi:hypothetical protein TW95_gp1218 [Pandoravirus inopinatum]|uniref:Uncharacterized protein n=1 Tax=Pandoravirus inopinatum TaxID=1605721 RepID=A0A0B5JDX1_9VIRU|nr:hypothetical protein TW95_gp1218 [Pandoravirus inopinatum]AJF97952.1 hypothetical protein [Pandoravirus inopinatum]